MPHARGTNRYPDVQEFMNRAQDSERGIRIKCDNKQTAWRLKMKVAAKKKDWRETYIRMYESDPDNPDRHRDPFAGISAYEREIDGTWYLYLMKFNPFEDAHIEGVEEL